MKRLKEQVDYFLRNQMQQFKRLKEQLGIWMISKICWSLLLTVGKEGTIDTFEKKGKSKQNVVEEDISTPISEKKKIYTVNKTEKQKP